MLIRSQDKMYVVPIDRISISIEKDYEIENEKTEKCVNEIGETYYHRTDTLRTDKEIYYITAKREYEQYHLGKYSSREKTIRVLDMICDRYKEIEADNKTLGIYRCNPIFQIPEDNEVE